MKKLVPVALLCALALLGGGRSQETVARSSPDFPRADFIEAMLRDTQQAARSALRGDVATDVADAAEQAVLDFDTLFGNSADLEDLFLEDLDLIVERATNADRFDSTLFAMLLEAIVDRLAQKRLELEILLALDDNLDSTGTELDRNSFNRATGDLARTFIAEQTLQTAFTGNLELAVRVSIDERDIVDLEKLVLGIEAALDRLDRDMIDAKIPQLVRDTLGGVPTITDQVRLEDVVDTFLLRLDIADNSIRGLDTQVVRDLARGTVSTDLRRTTTRSTLDTRTTDPFARTTTPTTIRRRSTSALPTRTTTTSRATTTSRTTNLTNIQETLLGSAEQIRQDLLRGIQDAIQQSLSGSRFTESTFNNNFRDALEIFEVQQFVLLLRRLAANLFDTDDDTFLVEQFVTLVESLVEDFADVVLETSDVFQDEDRINQFLGDVSRVIVSATVRAFVDPRRLDLGFQVVTNDLRQ